METNGSFKIISEKQWIGIMKDEERNRRSRSIDKKSIKSRDSSMNRNSRQQRNNRSRSPLGRRTRAPTNRRIYVANIPYDCKWTTVKDLFREKVGEVSYVELFEDEGGKFRGCGIVEFKDASSVKKAVDLLHRFEFRGRQLVVKEDFDVDRDKTGKPLGHNRGSGSGNILNRDFRRDDYGGLGSDVTPQYNTYGLSPQFLDALGISGPLTCRIFVANLDYKVTTQKLEEVFKLAGKVVNIDLKKKDDGNSKGHGTIEMGHPVEAVQAISMFNGQRFYNRIMSVRMDKRIKEDPEDKCLPEGLQSVGKGLGANGLPLHLSNSTGNHVGNQAATPTGVPGLAGIGMGLQEHNLATALLPSATALNTGALQSALSASTLHLGGFSDYNRSDDAYRRISDTIIIRNLPISYTWQNLRDRFRDIGDVRFTEMKGHGTAIIRFITERDAQRAVDVMCGVRIEGRPIDVAFY